MVGRAGFEPATNGLKVAPQSLWGRKISYLQRLPLRGPTWLKVNSVMGAGFTDTNMAQLCWATPIKCVLDRLAPQIGQRWALDRGFFYALTGGRRPVAAR